MCRIFLFTIVSNKKKIIKTKKEWGGKNEKFNTVLCNAKHKSRWVKNELQQIDRF